MKFSALAFTFLACALLSLTEAGLPPQPRCQCIKMVPKEIFNHRIVNIQIFQPGPHCRKTEIIATVKFQKVFTWCLNPNDKWVQNLLKKRNLAANNDTVKKMVEGKS